MNSSGKSKSRMVYLPRALLNNHVQSSVSKPVSRKCNLRQQDPIQKLQKKKQVLSSTNGHLSLQKAPSWPLVSFPSFQTLPFPSPIHCEICLWDCLSSLGQISQRLWDKDSQESDIFLEKFLNMGVWKTFWADKESKEGKKYQLKFHGASLWLNPTEKLWRQSQSGVRKWKYF